MTRRLGVAEAKAHFSDVLGEVRYRGERFVIERHGTPVAAIVPITDLPDDQRSETSRPAGALALVGQFDDAPEFSKALDRIVANRKHVTTRKVDLT